MYYALDIYSKATKKMLAYHSSDSRKDILHLKKMYAKNNFVYIKECFGETDEDKKIIGSLTNMEMPQLPVSLLRHMEFIGLLPVTLDDDGVNDIDIPNAVYGKRGGNSNRGNINSFRRDVLDENNEPLF